MTKGKKIATLAAVMAVSVIATCCGMLKPPGSIPLQDTRPLIERVVERHDSYIDSAAPDTLGALWLEESKLITEQVKGVESVEASWFMMNFEPVASRHDQWVREDPSLVPYIKSTALRNTAILRTFYPEEE